MSTTKLESPIVYMLTGIIPYSGGERSVICVYLDKEKANKRYEELRNGSEYYLDVQMDTYEVDDDEIVCVPLSKLFVTDKKPYKGQVEPPVFADDWETQTVDCSDVPSVIKPDMDGASLAKVAISLRREAKKWLKSNKNLTNNGDKLFVKNFACAIKAALNASYNNKDLAEILAKEGFTNTLTIWR